VPVIGTGFVTLTEGDAGTTEALFTFQLSAATGRSVSVNYATVNGSATGGASCGNPGVDYETTSGTISFQPGTTTVTVPVRICGDFGAEAIETFTIDLSNPSNAIVSQTPASVTIIDDDFLELLLDESDPNRPAALDAFLFVRDPFRVQLPDWFPTTGTDRNTRVMFFVRGLELNPGEPPSAVVVRMVNGFDLFDVPAEDVRPVPGFDLTQVTVRLPDGMPAGLYFCNHQSTLADDG
jgi:Calx-beta domain